MTRFIVAAIMLLYALTAPAHACKDGLSPESALAIDDPLRSMPPQEPTCPLPGCAGPPPFDPCPVYNGNAPFIRHPSMANGPVPNVGIDCFAVTREPNGNYYLFSGANTGSNGAFTRKKSTDQGLTWTTLSDATGFTGVSWLTGAQCPDPHFTGTSGQMTMVFSGHRAAGSIAVGRATSTNYGRSWENVQEIVPPTPSLSHFPYMPSLIELPASVGGGYLLAYAWVCSGSVTAGSTLDVLFSQNGITNWVPREVPGVPTGSCDTWDDGSANRPRLVLDPVNASTVHMFYSAYEWNGVNQPTRNCGRIGHAVSTNLGDTWTKKVRPVFEPSAFSWDELFVLKPTLVVEPCAPNAILRLFYQGNGPGASGLGIADAPWPFGSAGCGAAELALGEAVAPEDGEQPLARLTSAPNPTRGTTSIGIDLSRVTDAGEGELTIVDVTGRLVRRLWTGSTLAAPSTIEWDGRESGGSRVVPGRYLARLRQGDTTLGTHWITMTH